MSRTTTLVIILSGVFALLVGCSYDFGQDGKYYSCADDRSCRADYVCVEVDGQPACVPEDEADQFDPPSDAGDTDSPDTDPGDTEPTDTTQPDAAEDTSDEDTSEDAGEDSAQDTGDAQDTSTCTEECTPGCTSDGRNKIVCADPDQDGCGEPREIACGGTEYCDTVTLDCESCGSEHCDLFADATCAPAGNSGYSTAIEGCFPDDQGCGVETETQTCTNGVCASPNGQTQCLTHECNSDGCDNDRPYDCVTDTNTGQRVKSYRNACPGRTACQVSGGTSQCVCQHACSLGQERCDGAVYQYCDSDSNDCRYWVSQTDCENNNFNDTLGCSNGVIKCTSGPSDSCLKRIVEPCPAPQQCTMFGPGNFGCQ